MSPREGAVAWEPHRCGWTRARRAAVRRGAAAGAASVDSSSSLTADHGAASACGSGASLRRAVGRRTPVVGRRRADPHRDCRLLRLDEREAVAGVRATSPLPPPPPRRRGADCAAKRQIGAGGGGAPPQPMSPPWRTAHTEPASDGSGTAVRRRSRRGARFGVGAGVDDRRRADEVGGVAELVGVLVPHLHRAEGHVDLAAEGVAAHRHVEAADEAPCSLLVGRGDRAARRAVVRRASRPACRRRRRPRRRQRHLSAGASAGGRSSFGRCGRSPSTRRLPRMIGWAASSSGVRTSARDDARLAPGAPCAQRKPRWIASSERRRREVSGRRSLICGASAARAASGARGADVSVYEGAATRKRSHRGCSPSVGDDSSRETAICETLNLPRRRSPTTRDLASAIDGAAAAVYVAARHRDGRRALRLHRRCLLRRRARAARARSSSRRMSRREDAGEMSAAARAAAAAAAAIASAAWMTAAAARAAAPAKAAALREVRDDALELRLELDATPPRHARYARRSSRRAARTCRAACNVGDRHTVGAAVVVDAGANIGLFSLRAWRSPSTC